MEGTDYLKIKIKGEC
uniref:Uncharacterized protein n=1 Tax=Anguilla anguilla TaxID=7936 RepID=A0A0E9R1N5_ANGAN